MEELVARLRALFDSSLVVGDSKRVEEVRRRSTASSDIYQVRQALADYCASGSEDFRKFCFWNDIHYTRNLVVESDKFELIVLCWNKGQGSRIHNHAHSDCWMGVLDGHLTETQFVPLCPAGKPKCEATYPTPAPGPCPRLEQHSVTELHPGVVGYASDRLALHAVRTQPGVQSVSLHLYSPPIREVKIYEPETNHVLTRTPGFYSRAGQKA